MNSNLIGDEIKFLQKINTDHVGIHRYIDTNIVKYQIVECFKTNKNEFYEVAPLQPIKYNFIQIVKKAQLSQSKSSQMIREICSQIIDVFAFLHAQKIIHGGIHRKSFYATFDKPNQKVNIKLSKFSSAIQHNEKKLDDAVFKQEVYEVANILNFVMYGNEEEQQNISPKTSEKLLFDLMIQRMTHQISDQRPSFELLKTHLYLMDDNKRANFMLETIEVQITLNINPCTLKTYFFFYYIDIFFMYYLGHDKRLVLHVNFAHLKIMDTRRLDRNFTRANAMLHPTA